MRASRIAALIAALTLVVPATAAAQTFTLLHTFTGGDGANPVGSLMLSNATLYGMVSGNVFKMKPDGSACSNLHTFSSYAGNGNGPNAGLVLSGSTLYGTTVLGGSGKGVVFRVNTNGTAYTNIHLFAGGTADGSSPNGALTLAAGKLYGMTQRGGASNLGTVFFLNTDGTGYTTLHMFAGGSAEGANPTGELLPHGTSLYGMTAQGGEANLGVVFRLNTDGTGYTNLHSFAGTPGDGSGPPRSLTLAGSTLYGMAQSGGAANRGMVFRMDLDGSNYTNLHSFAGSKADGATPLGSLTLANGWLYGMTSASGASNSGTLFRLNCDGSGYTNLHSFAGGASDGAYPVGSLLLDGSTLYGMTFYGGTANKGVVFSLVDTPPEPPATLTIVYADTEAVVSWPSTASGWTLQTNTDLATDAWGDYAGPIAGNATTNLEMSGNLFFRLARP